MKFLDQAKIHLRSGDGGDGVIAFRRERFIEFGGPDGGNGGKGGDIVFEAVPNLNTLIDFRYAQHFRAAKGGNGSGSDRTGAGAPDVVIKVPVGTQIMDDDRETLLADLDRPGKRVLLCRGGDGGFGNAHYKTSTNRAPRRADKGWPGEERSVWLRLKLIADIGLLGLPNAGKSTFLSVVSAARPKIADYPFTTLHPQLGVVRPNPTQEFVIADIPGLIEGAHEGAGLGDRFLGHVERCAVLLHLVDGAAGDVVQAWRTVRAELAAYDARPCRQAGTDRVEQGRRDDAAPGLRPARGTRAGVRPAGLSAVGRYAAGCAGDRAGAAGGDHGGRTGGCGVMPVPRLADAQRIVVKIGSALIVDQKNSAPRTAWLAGVAADIAEMRAGGIEVIVVSSGAIALARRTLNLRQPRLRLEEKQAAASVGQIRLAQAWSEALSANGLTAAQLLLTLDDTEDRRRYLNARATLATLFALRCVPVINENDSVATAEIRFGDNDRLAARVAEMVQADQLILLSDIDGLYTADPRRDPACGAYPGRSGPDHAGDRGDGRRAAAGLLLGRDAHQAGRRAHRHAGRLRHGDRARPYRATRCASCAEGARCTWFLPPPEGRSARKRWIAGGLAPVGVLLGRCRRGARAAPPAARCCPPACATCTAVSSAATRWWCVGRTARALARGLSAYASGDAERIAGHRSERDRGDPGLARPRRDHPSRRSGAAVTALARGCRRATLAAWGGVTMHIESEATQHLHRAATRHAQARGCWPTAARRSATPRCAPRRRHCAPQDQRS